MNRMKRSFVTMLASAMLAGSALAQSDLNSNTNYANDAGWIAQKQDMSVTWPGGAMGTTIAMYSFKYDGGAVGNIDLDVAVPTNALVYDVRIDTVKPILPGGPGYTNAITMNSAGDILAATTNSMITVGTIAGIPQSAATAVYATAQRELYLARSGGAITSGVVMIYLDWVRTLTR